MSHTSPILRNTAVCHAALRTLAVDSPFYKFGLVWALLPLILAVRLPALAGRLQWKGGAVRSNRFVARIPFQAP
jgi:hypothetical protein